MISPVHSRFSLMAISGALVFPQPVLFGSLEDLSGLEDAKLFALRTIISGHRDSLGRIVVNIPILDGLQDGPD